MKPIALSTVIALTMVVSSCATSFSTAPSEPQPDGDLAENKTEYKSKFLDKIVVRYTAHLGRHTLSVRYSRFGYPYILKAWQIPMNRVHLGSGYYYHKAANPIEYAGFRFLCTAYKFKLECKIFEPGQKQVRFTEEQVVVLNSTKGDEERSKKAEKYLANNRMPFVDQANQTMLPDIQHYVPTFIVSNNAVVDRNDIRFSYKRSTLKIEYIRPPEGYVIETIRRRNLTRTRNSRIERIEFHGLYKFRMLQVKEHNRVDVFVSDNPGQQDVFATFLAKKIAAIKEEAERKARAKAKRAAAIARRSKGRTNRAPSIGFGTTGTIPTIDPNEAQYCDGIVGAARSWFNGNRVFPASDQPDEIRVCASSRQISITLIYDVAEFKFDQGNAMWEGPFFVYFSRAKKILLYQAKPISYISGILRLYWPAALKTDSTQYPRNTIFYVGIRKGKEILVTGYRSKKNGIYSNGIISIKTTDHGLQEFAAVVRKRSIELTQPRGFDGKMTKAGLVYRFFGLE